MPAPTISFVYNVETGRAIGGLYIGDPLNTATGSFGWGVTPVAAADRVTFTQTYSTVDTLSTLT